MVVCGAVQIVPHITARLVVVVFVVVGFWFRDQKLCGCHASVSPLPALSIVAQPKLADRNTTPTKRQTDRQTDRQANTKTMRDVWLTNAGAAAELNFGHISEPFGNSRQIRSKDDCHDEPQDRSKL